MGEPEDVGQSLDFGRRSLARGLDPGAADLDPGAADLDPDTDLDLDADRLREECGIFGIFGHPDAAAITALGLHALQHRGQEAAGIVTFDGQRFNSERRLGLVGDHFSKASAIERLPGELVQGGAIYQSTSDTEAILHLVSRSRRPRLVDRFIEALRSIEGAYSLAALSN